MDWFFLVKRQYLTTYWHLVAMLRTNGALSPFSGNKPVDHCLDAKTSTRRFVLLQLRPSRRARDSCSRAMLLKPLTDRLPAELKWSQPSSA
jgi:hypothetical protein